MKPADTIQCPFCKGKGGFEVGKEDVVRCDACLDSTGKPTGRALPGLTMECPCGCHIISDFKDDSAFMHRRQCEDYCKEGRVLVPGADGSMVITEMVRQRWEFTATTVWHPDHMPFTFEAGFFNERRRPRAAEGTDFDATVYAAAVKTMEAKA